MNKITQHINANNYAEANAETVAYRLSQNIAEVCGLQSIPEQLNYVTGKYRLIATRRLFNAGWVHLLEINPVKCDSPAGYVNTPNPHWPILRSGTSAINVPPQKDIDLFFLELQKHTIEEK